MHRGDGCIIDVAGDELTLVDGHGLTLATTRGWRFHIDGPTTWATASGHVERVSPHDPRLHAVSGRRVELVAAFVDGRLEIDLAGGERLTAEPAPAADAWQAVGPRGTRITSLAGGALTLSR